MAEHARELARANGVADIVEVIQGTVEDVELPEKGEP
jgi:protein arginine N-methyltransferase 1